MGFLETLFSYTERIFSTTAKITILIGNPGFWAYRLAILVTIIYITENGFTTQIILSAKISQ